MSLVNLSTPEKHTDRANQHMKPPVRQFFMSSHQERVLHQRLLCNNSSAKAGRQANTSQPLQERKAEMLLNLVTLSCPRKQA